MPHNSSPVTSEARDSTTPSAAVPGSDAPCSNAPSSDERYRQRGFWPRWRLRLTMLGMLLLPFLSWQWGNAHMGRWSVAVGAVLTLIGAALRWWAAGWLRKNEALATDGPYALVRHPLYLGTGLIACGQGLMSALPLAPLLFPLLWLLLYRPAMREEEAFLLSRYGAACEKYFRDVYSLVPCWSGVRRAVAGSTFGAQMAGFSWAQAWRNREYEAALVNIITIVVYSWLQMRR